MNYLSVQKVSRRNGNILRAIEQLFLLAGCILLGVYLGARLHSLLASRIALQEFKDSNGMIATFVRSNSSEENPVDFSLWNEARVKAYKAALALSLAKPVAVLNIPRIRLTAPVFDGTDEINLNRGLGRIRGTGTLDGNGNLGIAGHRDGFFRGLKDIRMGDIVEIATYGEKDSYVVNSIEIVDPKDIRVLAPQSITTITLVTCYPFYFIGDAPHRFIVKAALTHRDIWQQARIFSPQVQQTDKKEK